MSVKKNNFHDIEHIVVDGKSTDQSHIILDQYQKSFNHIKWIRFNDSGQSNALNIAIQVSGGDILGWLNADEMYLPGTISLINTMFEGNPNLDIIFGDTIFCDQSGKFIRLKSSYSFSELTLYKYGAYISTCSFFFRKRCLDFLKKPIFNEELNFSMDWDFFIALNKAQLEFHYVPKALGIFRVHELAKTFNGNSNEIIHERNDVVSLNSLGKLSLLPAWRIWHGIKKMIHGAYLREIQFKIAHRIFFKKT